MTHLECNPQVLGITSKQGGLRFHEWKVQMGLPQSDLLPIQKSIQAIEISHSRRILSDLPLQPQIRDSATQWSSTAKDQHPHFPSRRPTYGAKVIWALTAIWQAAGYPCSARLKALLPLWLPWAIKHLTLSTQVQKQLLTISPATIDRRLGVKKRQLQKRLYRRTKPGTLLKHHIPIKTDSWNVQSPGFTEIDLVSHSGNSASGDFLYSLNVTDIHSTWVETRAVMGKSQIGVLDAMKDIQQALPFKLVGIDSDNGSEFINYHLKTFCDQNQIQFTRGRPYKKDDNAHIEQKNWTHVRKIFGYERYDSPPALEAMNDLYPKRIENLAKPVSAFHEAVRKNSHRL